MRLALAIFSGLIVGALTLFGQGILPGSWNHFANSGAVWLLAAFLVASAMPNYPWAIISGVIVLLGALGGYTLTAGLMGYSYTLSAFLIYGALALAGGPLYGAAGRGWRAGDLRRRVVGLALLGGVFVAEGWFMMRYNHDSLAGWVSIAIGILLAALLARSFRERLYTLLAMLPVVALGMGLYAFLSTLVFT